MQDLNLLEMDAAQLARVGGGCQQCELHAPSTIDSFRRGWSPDTSGGFGAALVFFEPDMLQPF